MKHSILKTVLIILIFVSILIVSAAITLSLYNIHIVLKVKKPIISDQITLNWRNDLNQTQTGNTCGAHSVMAVMFSLNGIIENPYTIYDSIGEKLGNGYIYPWGLTQYLKKVNIQSRIYYLGFLSFNNRDKWIKQKINNKQPVIIIVGNRKYLHYITLLGYNDNKYYIYDSLLEGDMNADDPGNITVNSKEVLGRMNSAIFKGIALNMAISS